MRIHRRILRSAQRIIKQTQQRDMGKGRWISPFLCHWQRKTGTGMRERLVVDSKQKREKEIVHRILLGAGVLCAALIAVIIVTNIQKVSRINSLRSERDSLQTECDGLWTECSKLEGERDSYRASSEAYQMIVEAGKRRRYTYQPVVHSTMEWQRNIEGDTNYEITMKHYYAARNYLATGIGDRLWENAFFLGDSVTESVVGDSLNLLGTTYPATVAEVLNIGTYEVNAIGGSGFSSHGGSPFYGRREEFPETADVVFVMGGINDSFLYNTGEIELGTPQDGQGLAGEIEQVYSYIDERYPDADVFAVIPYNLMLDWPLGRIARQECLYETYDLIRQMAESHGYYIIDLSECGFLELTDQTCKAPFYSGGVHPNGYGFRMLGEMIAADAVRLRTGSENGLEGYDQLPEIVLPTVNEDGFVERN